MSFNESWRAEYRRFKNATKIVFDNIIAIKTCEVSYV